MENNSLFPVNIYPDSLQRIIEDTHKDLNFPVNYIASTMLLGVSLAIGNSRVLKFKENWIVKAPLYMVLVGDPGAVKTHPINFALAPFRKRDGATLSAYRNELDDYRSQAIDRRGEKPKAKQFLMKDFTPEAVAKVMDSNPHGICIHCDELNGWFASFNRYNSGGGEQEMWLSLHSGDSLVVNRKSSDDIIVVSNPFANVLGSIQPEVLSKCFKGQRTENGFLYRMLFVSDSSQGAPLLWKEDDIPSGAGENWDRFISKLLELSKPYSSSKVATEYTFCSEAFTVLLTWQNIMENELAEEGNQYKVAIFRKIQDYALRFCLIVHAMRECAGEIEQSATIGPLTVAKSISVAEYFFNTAIEVYEYIHFGSNDENSKYARLLEFLPEEFTMQQAISAGVSLGISRSTISRHIRGDRSDPFTEKVKHGLYRKKTVRF